MNINADYYSYLTEFINSGVHNGRRYDKLLTKLQNTIFQYDILMDANRASDGIEMRYRFGFDRSIPQPIIASELDISECSMLEMMIALAVRVEETYLYDGYTDHTEKFFFDMIRNLGLIYQDDEKYNDIYVTDTITNFFNKNYDYDGLGSLFIVNGYRDMRTIDIWTAMNWWLDEKNY